METYNRVPTDILKLVRKLNGLLADNDKDIVFMASADSHKNVVLKKYAESTGRVIENRIFYQVEAVGYLNGRIDAELER